MLDNLLNVDSSIRIDFTLHFTGYTLLGYLQHAVAISKEAVFTIRYSITMGSAGFEPAASSAQGWHHTKLDNDPGQFSFSFLAQYLYIYHDKQILLSHGLSSMLPEGRSNCIRS